MTRRRSMAVLRTRTRTERALDACAGYFRALADTLSWRFWAAVIAATTAFAFGVVFDVPVVRYVGAVVVAILLAMWLAVGTSEHVRQLRLDREHLGR
jgi:hypothetical protein